MEQPLQVDDSTAQVLSSLVKSEIEEATRDRLREIDVVTRPLVPFLYSESMLQQRQRRGAGRYAAGTKSCPIPADRCPR
jgi:hypothetical protein